MDFFNTKTNKGIEIFGIDDFDVSNWYNASQLKNVFRSLFALNETVYFSFRREESLTDNQLLRKLRIKIPEIFSQEGEYIILRQLDEARFDSVARLMVKESTFEFFLDLWNYFYSCAFFLPKTGFTFSAFIDFYKLSKFTDEYGEKLLTQCYADFECIKGLGGDSLLISYRKGYQLPDLKKAILDTPDISKLFR